MNVTEILKVMRVDKNCRTKVLEKEVLPNRRREETYKYRR
jgi:hypothetical protein